jgi:branched-chain amino acid transport system substrate-binding protein
MKARSLRIAAVLLTMGTIAAGCSSGGSESSDTTAPKISNDWALAYTGGTAGAASGDSVKIGYVNQEALFPEATIGLKAGVDYINAELGGVGGRPIEIVECDVATEEDGQKCGTQFANDATVNLVMTGTLTVGNASLYEALNGKKPVLIGNGVTVTDFLSKAGVAFTTGSIGVIQAMAKFAIENLAAKNVAIVHNNNAAGQAAYDVLLKPAFDKAGVTSVGVGVEDAATATDVQTAVQAAGADKADVILPVVVVQVCSSLYDALKALGVSPKVVTTGLCYGTPVKQHMKDIGDKGDFPDGWYYVGYGYSYFRPDDTSGMSTYVSKVFEYGKAAEGQELEYTGFGGPMFANIMTAAKLINQIGVDKVTPSVLDTAMRGFTGPMMLQAGDLKCGVPPFIAVCGHVAGVQQYTADQGWVSAADALNNMAIDVRG